MPSRKRPAPPHKADPDGAREPERLAAVFGELNLLARIRREIERDDDRHRASAKPLRSSKPFQPSSLW